MKKFVGIIVIALILIFLAYVYIREGQKGIEMQKQAAETGREQISTAKQSVEELNQKTQEGLEQAQQLMENNK
jgi:predicted Holliday junction resolvase-like endonuclease